MAQTLTDKPLKDFIAENHIRVFSVKMVNENKNAPDWKNANHYRVVLKCGKRTLTTYFSMGLALTSEPTAEDVLDCLASDVAGFLNAWSFEDWCEDYGYDTDSRKAEKIYRVIESHKDQLQQWLGGYDTLNALCFETERQ